MPGMKQEQAPHERCWWLQIDFVHEIRKTFLNANQCPQLCKHGLQNLYVLVADLQ